MNQFSKLGVKQAIAEALQQQGLAYPTPVQKQVIPTAMKGNDVIAEAQTGSGKTLAFLLPIFEKINVDHPWIQALILTPTRELALQITMESQKYVTDEIRVLSVYGGQDVERQIKQLEGAQHIVIATPGRLLDHLRRGTICLNTITTLVLDEADQMLHMGFLPEVEEIISQVSDKRQTMLFSATMPRQIVSLAQKYMNNPVEVRITPDRITVEDVEQWLVETTDRRKQEMLRQMLQHYRPFLAIIFCRTKRRANTLYEALVQLDYNCDQLHGDISQSKRESVLKRFRQMDLQLLIATDVAARGLDIDGVTHVFNYDIPHDVESYVHRIGRTGRAGQRGVAITLVAPKDRPHLELIEKGIGMKLRRISVQLPQTREQDRQSGKHKQLMNTKIGDKEATTSQSIYEMRRQKNIQANIARKKKR